MLDDTENNENAAVAAPGGCVSAVRPCGPSIAVVQCMLRALTGHVGTAHCLRRARWDLHFL